MAKEQPGVKGLFGSKRSQVEVSFDRATLKLLTDALAGKEQLAILQRIEQKVDKMAINLDKANAGLESLNASFNEIVAEFAELREQLNDPASQAAVDAFGDKLTAMADGFRAINPDLPPPPPEDPNNPGVASRRRR